MMKQNKCNPIHNQATFFLLCLLIIFCKTVTTNDLLTSPEQFCSENGTYDEGSIFENNLNSLLTNLSSEATTKRFFNTTSGEAPNTVHGLFLCTASFNLQGCRDCITTAAGQVHLCPNNVEAIILYPECMLRYANRSIFSIEDDRLLLARTSEPSNYRQYNEQVLSKFRELISEATVDSQAFASETSILEDVRGLSAYVACTPDLSPSDCSRCLLTGLSRLPIDGGQGGVVIQTSCQLSYLFVEVGSSPSGESTRLSYNAFIVVIVVACGAVLTTLLLLLYICLRKRKARGKPTGMDEIESMENLHLEFNTIKTATDNFSTANKIGQGGFGVVYMGTLPDGQAIAVKRLASPSGQGIREFKSEACLAAKLQHKNLVKLFGFCLEGEEKLLVYEFVPNKSLDRFLFDTKRGVHLKWETRKKIIVGIARGILYLHEDSRFKIIHRDLKPSNVLLDGDMNPKIADFGMAKLFGADQTQGNTSRVAGTFGYMAPEYASTGHISIKSDIFSFGVILLEIVSGRRNRVSDLENQDNLLNHAWRLWNEGDVVKLIDPNLKDNCSMSEVTRCTHIGLLCVQEDEARRPAIASVLSMLSSQSVTLPSLTAPPALPYKRKISEALNASNAQFTEEVFTNMHGR